MTDGARILLLVDDNADQAELMRRTLERQRPGYTVTVVGDGFACLEALARERYAAVLLDYSLPSLNGLEVLERIRAGASTVPVIMVTGQGDERVAVEALKGGATDYVLKTSGYLAKLPTVVANVLKGHALALENARLQEETRRRLRDTEALLEMARSLSATLEFDALLPSVARAAARTCQMDRCTVYLREEERLLPVTCQLAEGEDDARCGALLGAGPIRLAEVPFVAEAIGRGEPVAVADASRDPRVPPGLASAGPAAILVLPLLRQDRALGALILDRAAAAGPVTPEQVALGRAVASQVALAVENARLYRDAQQALADLRAAQERLVRGETLRALGELASGAAHHLNNLLAVIHARVQLLLLDEPGEAIERPLKIVERAAKDGAEVVRRIQQFSRTKQMEDAEPVNLNELTAEVVEMTRVRWQDAARAQGIALEVSCEPGPLPLIAGHPAALREVLTNLLMNAIDAMPGGGRIVLRTWAEDGKVFLAIRDAGVGMSPEVLRRAQEPFFTTKGLKSTGLGLSVNYGIVKRHGGDVTIESAEGRGTTVTVWLPANGRAARLGAAPPRPSRAAATLRVLVIDDESEVRQALAELIARDGYAVAQAPGPHEGLALIEAEGPPDVVLTDLGMPGMTGWEVARAIKTRWPEVAVGLITGWSAEPPAAPAGPAAVDFVMGKPVKLPELRDRLARCQAAGLGGEAVRCHGRSS